MVLLKKILKEHGEDIKNGRSCTSTLAKHSLKTKHHVYQENAKIMAREDHYQKRKIREALKISKYLNKLNRDGGNEINGNWHPMITHISASRSFEV